MTSSTLLCSGNGKEEYEEEEVYESLYDTSTLLCPGNSKEEYEEEEVYESLYDNINSVVFRQHQGGV